MEKVYIIGAGTLGKFIVEIIESDAKFKVGGFYDDNFPEINSVFEYPVIGKTNEINSNHKLLAIAVGEPKYRKIIFEKGKTENHIFPALVHASVLYSKRCKIDEGVIIGPNSSVLTGSHVKTAACILSHVNINQDVIIEPFCLIAAGVIIGNNSILGEGCHIGMGSYIKLNQTVEPWYNFYK